MLGAEIPGENVKDTKIRILKKFNTICSHKRQLIMDMLPYTTLDKKRVWKNFLDSYPVVLTHVETVCVLTRK